MVQHARSPIPSRPTRRLLLGSAASAAAAAGMLGLSATPASAAASLRTHTAERRPVPALPAPPSDARAAAEVRAEYLHGWYGYTRAAWGHDEVMPLTGGRHDFFAPGRTFGLSIVEALDTLHLMGCDREAARARAWIEAHLDPTQDAEVEVFEAIIRLVGGLLAGHLTTGSPILLARAREFADRLLPAFTASPTGIPYTHVNLRTGHVRGNAVALAQAGTNVMEFGLLSRLLGDGRYYHASLRAYRAILARRSALGLLGTTIDAETGRWLDRTSSAPNPPVDSFYEYLWGGGRLLGDAQLTRWYRELTSAVLSRQPEDHGGLLWFHPVDAATGARTGPDQQSELAAFYPGLLAKGGDVATGARYFRSWSAVLARYPVLPETVDCASLTAVDAASQLRPEYANSAFDLWRLTGDASYKRAAWHWFEGMRTHQRVPGGYTIATQVTGSSVRLGDLTPAYWFAENLKYLWLMFSATPRFDYRTGILSTEGKVLAGAR